MKHLIQTITISSLLTLPAYSATVTMKVPEHGITLIVEYNESCKFLNENKQDWIVAFRFNFGETLQWSCKD